jgi:hypothetical protein
MYCDRRKSKRNKLTKYFIYNTINKNMDLTEDSIKEVCSRMDVNTLFNFIESSKQNYMICVNVFNLKRYEEIEYPKLMYLYEAKQYILKYLRNVENNKPIDPRKKIGLVISSGISDNGFNYGLLRTKLYIDDDKFQQHNIFNIPGYPKLFVQVKTKETLLYPDIYNTVVNIMSTEDPNIKLEQLKRLV